MRASDELVSVIIPCYRQGVFLPQAIQSLQQQSYENWEALIVDDGSPDDTAEIATSLLRADGRIRYLAKTNGGLSSARNAGLRAARGELIQLLDADDYLAPRKFENAVRFLAEHPSIDVVYTSAYYFSESPHYGVTRGPYAANPDHDWILEAWSEPRPLIEKFADRNLFPVCSPIVRKRAFDCVGFFDESLHALEDWDYWVRAVLAGVRFQYVDADGDEAFIRWHSQSMTRDRTRIRRAAYRFRLLNQQRIPPGVAREKNFQELLRIAASLGDEGRGSRYAEIQRSCKSWTESLRAIACARFDRGGTNADIARHVVRRFPRRLRQWLASQGLRFAGT